MCIISYLSMYLVDLIQPDLDYPYGIKPPHPPPRSYKRNDFNFKNFLSFFILSQFFPVRNSRALYDKFNSTLLASCDGSLHSPHSLPEQNGHGETLILSLLSLIVIGGGTLVDNRYSQFDWLSENGCEMVSGRRG